jgi:hypothetical protein
MTESKDNFQTQAPPDLKNVQDLTNFVQVTLQQMQDKFQLMSDQIISRNILFKILIFF